MIEHLIEDVIYIHTVFFDENLLENLFCDFKKNIEIHRVDVSSPFQIDQIINVNLKVAIYFGLYLKKIMLQNKKDGAIVNNGYY